jgi:dTDP-4-amino-4,6-dideoxygalactose transaminase
MENFVATPVVRSGAEHAYHLYVVRAASNGARDAAMAALKARGIATAIHYPVPVHRQKAYAGRVLEGPCGLANTERLSGEIISLPMHPFLSEADVAAVIEGVQEVFRAAR